MDYNIYCFDKDSEDYKNNKSCSFHFVSSVIPRIGEIIRGTNGFFYNIEDVMYCIPYTPGSKCMYINLIIKNIGAYYA